MTAIAPNDLLERLQWRYATKSFDPNKPIPTEIWQALETSLQLTPSSYGLQPWKFIAIVDPQLKEQLRPFSWNQAQITDCSHLVVFTIRKNLTVDDVDLFVQTTAATRGVSADSLATYRDLMVNDVIYGARSFHVNDWATRQVYIALGNFLTSAALLGVDTCPLEGIEPTQYDRILQLPERGLATVVACAAGYRAADDKYATLPKVRYPKAEVIQVL